jgi:mannan endo-1,4-beta-mannosidase
LKWILPLGLALLLDACAPPTIVTAVRRPEPVAAPDPDPFVRVGGGRFFLGGRPFRFLGANVAVMFGPRQRAAYEATLDAAVEDGLRVVRVWALGEADAPGEPWRRDYAFRIGPDGWVEESFAHLDRVVAAARERDLRVILVLANRWKDLGGVPQYLRWAGIEGAPAPGRDVAATELGLFYRSERAEVLYRAHVERVVGRVNEVTGVPYAEDPTVFGWELINEAGASTMADADALVAWVDRQSRFVRRLDAVHAISAGLIGYRTPRERALFQRVLALPHVAYADVHAYPASENRLQAEGAVEDFVADRAFLARRELGVPLVFGEVGIPRRAPGRPERLRRILRAVADAGADGALLWLYSPVELERPRRHGIYPSTTTTAPSEAPRCGRPCGRSRPTSTVAPSIPSSTCRSEPCWTAAGTASSAWAARRFAGGGGGCECPSTASPRRPFGASASSRKGPSGGRATARCASSCRLPREAAR